MTILAVGNINRWKIIKFLLEWWYLWGLIIWGAAVIWVCWSNVSAVPTIEKSYSIWLPQNAEIVKEIRNYSRDSGGGTGLLEIVVSKKDFQQKSKPQVYTPYNFVSVETASPGSAYFILKYVTIEGRSATFLRSYEEPILNDLDAAFYKINKAKIKAENLVVTYGADWGAMIFYMFIVGILGTIAFFALWRGAKVILEKIFKDRIYYS